MLIRKALRTGLCVVALGWGAARLYGEVMTVPEASPVCVDGACVPRRVTNGYYPTKWRPWPVPPPAAARPGVRPGIPAPPVELPDPSVETQLPEGAIPAPSPREGPDVAPDNDMGPRTRPTAPPPARGPAGIEPRPGLPPELRNELRNEVPRPSLDDQGSRLPADNRSPRRIPAIALRGGNRPAAVVKALRNEAAWQPVNGNDAREESRIPGILPSDAEETAEPLHKAPAAAAPFRPETRSYDHREESPNAELPAPANTASGSTTSASTCLGARLYALRERAAELDDSSESAVGWTGMDRSEAPAEGSSLRLSATGLNAPATVRERHVGEGVRRASAVADLTISSPAPSAVLAVRTTGHDGWSQSGSKGNPLRGGSPVTRVAFESAEAFSDQRRDEETDSELNVRSSSSDTAVPANPLR